MNCLQRKETSEAIGYDKTASTMFCIVIILCSIFCRGVSMTCASKQFTERMSNKTITCYVDEEVERCLWYLGSTTSTSPILKLENGIKGGTKLSDTHYDITDDCGMEITEAQIQHEANYKFVAFFSDGKVWRQNVSVIVTVTPTHRCPRVPTCNACNKCTVASSENEVKILTCYIDRIRPAVSLNWHHEGDIKIVSNTSHSEPDYSTSDTWNSSATIEYSLSCQEKATLYCISKDVNVSTALVEVISECDTVSSSADSSDTSPANIWKIVLGLTVTLLAIIVAAIFTIWIIRKRSNTQGPKSMENDLKEHYSHFLIPEMETLYISCKVGMQGTNSKNAYGTTAGIINMSFLSENKRALLISDPGNGKTAFFQHLLQRWVNDDAMQGVMLIYFHLKCMSKRSKILEEIMAMLPEKPVYDVISILKETPSLVVLDGLNYLDVNQVSSDATKEDNVNEYTLTVEHLLLNKSRQFPKMNVWISSRPFDHKEIISKPLALIRIKEFKEQERDQFFSRTIDNYHESRKSKTNKTSNKVETEENASLLPVKDIASMKDEWNKLYPNTEESKKVSPLVVQLFAFNFFLSVNGELPIITNSTLPYEVSWDVDKFKVDLSQVNWHLLACLLESSNQDESKELIIKKVFEGKSITFEKGKAGYQRNAVTMLCMMCRKSNVEVESLMFCKDYPRLLHQYLPSIKNELILKKTMLVKEDFISLINRSSERIGTLSFIDCQMPGNFTAADFEERGNLNVIRMEKKKTYFFDFKTINWIKETGAQENAEDMC